ncbi:MAG: response regulator [Actinomycetes bacterium]
MPTVLIADDSPTLRRIVSTVLERAGYAIVTAEDGVEAVQAAFRAQPDAIILDVQMPRLSGYVAARLLKDDWQTSEIPLLLLT